MPSWPVHFAVAKKLNEKLKINPDLFYYGNILPDVGNKFNLDRDKVHYYGIPYSFCPKEEKIDINRFLIDYKDNIYNPLVLGYFCHLLTDNYFNEAIYKKCWVLDKDNNVIGIKLKNNKIKKILPNDSHEARKYKHHDFELYGRYIYDPNIVPKDKQKIYDNLYCIKKNYLSKAIIDDRFDYFQNKYLKDSKLSLYEKIFKHKYLLFTKNELDKIFHDCCTYILTEINNLR